tara:strand:+ start:43 stop:351 length:309 start_codon:yes stop_codon:yes gene_type:complete
MNVILFITFLIFIVTSCTSIKEAGQVLRNEKIKTTDEFLVKKKQPLILPPDYDKIPEPGSSNKIQNNDKNKIRKILKQSDADQADMNKSGSVEKSIIDKIRK